jgi:hypothetical protein
MDRPVIRIHGRSKSTIRRLLSAAVAILAVTFIAAPSAAALALPRPKEFVSYLDLECFKTNPYQPPATTLMVRHLNPVLSHLPVETVTLGTREQLCVPVAKNEKIPPNTVLDFIRFVDLSCYRITGTQAGTTLALHQLNPLLTDVPRQEIHMGTPQQLCVPVLKGNLLPPAEVMAFIRHIDLMCYEIRSSAPMNRALNLRQLNRVIADQIRPMDVRVTEARQLCVPVQKRGDDIPRSVLEIVQWIDLEKYDVIPATATPIVTVALRHLNPVLGHLPTERATLVGRSQLAVPVAKNGMFPPG